MAAISILAVVFLAVGFAFGFSSQILSLFFSSANIVGNPKKTITVLVILLIFLLISVFRKNLVGNVVMACVIGVWVILLICAVSGKVVPITMITWSDVTVTKHPLIPRIGDMLIGSGGTLLIFSWKKGGKEKED